jgi:NLR family CARD domain-containing protein 3
MTSMRISRRGLLFSLLFTRYQPLVTLAPRTDDDKWVKPAGEGERIFWSYEQSIFQEYKFDTDKIYRECFEFDWKCSNLEKFLKDLSEQDQKKIRYLLMKNYNYIMAGFKYFSSFYNPKVFSIGQNSMREFIHETRLTDRGFSENDILLQIQYCNQGSADKRIDKKVINDNKRSLTRYQFTEFLVRAADDKFVKSGKAKDKVEALEMML